MSVFLNPAAYGSSLSGNLGVMSPAQAFKTATQNASNHMITDEMMKAYKDAVAANPDAAAQFSAGLKQKLASTLSTTTKRAAGAAKIAESGYVAGVGMSTTDTLVKYAPYALGGLAVIIAGVVLMRRK